MKKIMTGILSLVLMLNLTGCGSSTKTSAEPSKELVVVDWGGNYTD